MPMEDIFRKLADRAAEGRRLKCIYLYAKRRVATEYLLRRYLVEHLKKLPRTKTAVTAVKVTKGSQLYLSPSSK